MKDIGFYHKPIMVKECINALNIRGEGTYVDATAGGGGHSVEIANLLSSGTLFCIDRDEDAISHTKKRMSEYTNIIYEHDNYLNLTQILEKNAVNKIDGILMDLGISSWQIDSPLKGFSYMKDAPIDMRMDKRQQLSAYNVINEYDESALAKIMFEYGEEKFSKRIASTIVNERQVNKITTTLQLVNIIERAIPKSKRVTDSAKRVFQAVRIEVNGELLNLSSFIKSLPCMLNDFGRIAIITFHSLEDRIVKKAFNEMQNPCKCPPEFPICACGKKSVGHVINKKPILPKNDELNDNSRARSAKLRIFEKGG